MTTLDTSSYHYLHLGECFWVYGDPYRWCPWCDRTEVLNEEENRWEVDPDPNSAEEFRRGIASYGTPDHGYLGFWIGWRINPTKYAPHAEPPEAVQQLPVIA